MKAVFLSNVIHAVQDANSEALTILRSWVAAEVKEMPTSYYKQVGFRVIV